MARKFKAQDDGWYLIDGQTYEYLKKGDYTKVTYNALLTNLPLDWTPQGHGPELSDVPIMSLPNAHIEEEE